LRAIFSGARHTLSPSLTLSFSEMNFAPRVDSSIQGLPTRAPISILLFSSCIFYLLFAIMLDSSIESYLIVDFVDARTFARVRAHGRR